MSYTTLARPYAKAAFEFASEQDRIPAWNLFLQKLALTVVDPQVKELLTNPKLNVEDKKNFLADIVGETDTTQRNFLDILGHYHRLLIIPDITALFDVFYKEREKSIEVEVISAYPLDAAQKKRLQQALKIRLQRKINLKVIIDKNLIGGAVIRAGDLVIDGSSLSQLKRLRQDLIA